MQADLKKVVHSNCVVCRFFLMTFKFLNHLKKELSAQMEWECSFTILFCLIITCSFADKKIDLTCTSVELESSCWI